MIITAIDIDNKQPSDFKLHREHGRSDYLFVLFKSPTYVFIKNKYVLTATGDCIFFDKHKIQSYFPLENHEFLHDYMHFDLDNEHEKTFFSEIPKGQLISLSMPYLISGVMIDIKKELYSTFAKYKENVLSNLFSIFLYRIKSELEQTGSSDKIISNHRVLCQLHEKIYAHPERKWSVEAACRETCLSRSYFQHQYSAFFKISFMEDVILARMAYAKNLLLNSSCSIYEISKKCGYQNVTHFNRQFKKIVGVSPNNFRFN